MLSRLGNYRLFLFSNSILAFASGLFVPFWIIFLQDFGGSIEQFGFAIGLMMLAQSITSYYVGRYSDKVGRKVFLIVGGFILTGVVFAYTLITSLVQLYILQIINGVTSSMQATMEATFLGDITKKAKRGADIGRYHAIVGIMAALSMMGGGFVVGQMGFKIIFYVTASIIFISTLMLFYIREK
ncbi:MAG: MFS transporter [Candidatus Aenigmarchaeota archaeon]|nr:MFS transporter [Candidatus Aenigmarchaeota archaeon]